MPKINSYENKAFTDIVQEADFLIVTNGTQEYNISIEEFFNWHLNATSHNHSAFRNETEIRSIAQAEATPIINTAITAHETTYDHSLFLTATTIAPIVNTQIQATNIGALANVDTSEVEDGQTLMFEDGVWHPTSGGATFLAELEDVFIDFNNIALGDVLIFNGDGFENGTISGSGASTLAELDDVNITSTPETFSVLRYWGGEGGDVWTPEMLTLSSLEGVDAFGAQDGYVLTYDGESNVWLARSGPTTGASGTFESADGKNITVTNGIITDITNAIIPS